MSKAATIIGLLAGIALLLAWGGEVPAWLLKLECLAVMAAALVFGFTAYNPAVPGWLRHDAVKGVALVYLGVGAAFLPANLLLSAFLIGSGCKLVMKSAAPLVSVWSGQAIHRDGEITIHQGGGIRRNDHD